MTNKTNTILWAWDSKPFGESQPNEDVDGDNTKLNYNIRFPGQYYDQETGKHYNFNRDYDPVTGRYMQSDPIGLNAGMNGYGYGDNYPLLFSDLRGLRFSKNIQKYNVSIVASITVFGAPSGTNGWTLTTKWYNAIIKYWSGQRYTGTRFPTLKINQLVSI